jgi:hypothetical protein
MISESQLDLFDPKGGRRGRCDWEFSQPFKNTGAHAYAQVGRFEKVPPCTAPSAPCDTAPDPARNYPNKASIKTAFDAWQAAGEPWPPPAGLTSAIASRLIPRGNRGASQWRK